MEENEIIKRGRPAQQPITVAVDAGMLGVGDERLKVGVYTYASQLLHKLSVIDKKNTYLLFSFSRIPREELDQLGDRFKNIVLPRWGWFRVWLPLSLRFWKPDIFLALAQALPETSIPTLGFIYDNAFERFPQGYPDSYKKLSRQTRFLAQHAQSIITISEDSKEEIHAGYGIPKARIAVAYPGVVSDFSPDGPRFIGDKPYFLYVGALKRTKNITVLLRAFGQFLNEYQKPYRLLLVGSDAWMDPEIEKTIKSLNLRDEIVLKGYVSASDLPQYYRGAQAFIMPSLFEGFGIPALEALACGVPVVASNIPSLREIIGDAGILISPNDQEALKKALLTIVESEQERKRLGEKGISRARRFLWHKCATVVLQGIRKLSLKIHE